MIVKKNGHTRFLFFSMWQWGRGTAKVEALSGIAVTDLLAIFPINSEQPMCPNAAFAFR